MSRPRTSCPRSTAKQASKWRLLYLQEWPCSYWPRLWRDSKNWISDADCEAKSDIRNPTSDISLLLRFLVFLVLQHACHDWTIGGSLAFGFFLALDTERGPRHSHQPFFIDVFTA